MEGNGIRIIEAIIKMGVELGASDIHLEPVEDDLKIRMRIDGILQDIERLGNNRSSLISRVKIMSGMDIAERRIPQDGRSEIEFGVRKIDLRISSLPTIYGEKIVIRILDKGKKILELKNLAMSELNFELYKKLYSKPYGMVLLTGPTGSGKSTTLYATLNQINTSEKNIITIENPVEYQMPGINQVAVNNKAGLTFAKGLRAIVRQDPDVIMVGEIRDEETARIAVKAALTGHLVFSTLHTNNALSTLTRLLDMGVERYQLASAFNGSVAQRLVRKLCKFCRAKRQAKAYELAYLNMDGPLELYDAIGCDACKNIGYKGRIAVQEIFVFDEEIMDAFVKNKNESDLVKIARKNGMKTLREDAREKVLNGMTTVKELLRVGV